MKKNLLIMVIILLMAIPLTADPISLDTEITSVSGGPYKFGLELAPIGTNFRYYEYFQLHPALKHDARFRVILDFYFPHRWYSGYNYKTGTPEWANKYHEIKDNEDYSLWGEFFNPSGDVNISLYQGFGTNPVAQEGHLIKLGFELESRYSMALESLDTHLNMSKPKFINPETGEYYSPFEPGGKIQAYPWLQDTRNTLVNSMLFEVSMDLSVNRGYGVYDGMAMSTYIDYGPSWFGNNLTMNEPTSDYYRIVATMTEYLALYSKKQDNGFNWLSIQLRHKNAYEYVGGDIIPRHRLPSDRLQHYFSDAIIFDIYGPQFIAWDCYSDITLGLYNSCYFGHIANEPSKETFAMEWNSSLEMSFHMRLFGFMHFKYNAGYTFYEGIHTTHPVFYQNAKVYFYISL